MACSVYSGTIYSQILLGGPLSAPPNFCQKYLANNTQQLCRTHQHKHQMILLDFSAQQNVRITTKSLQRNSQLVNTLDKAVDVLALAVYSLWKNKALIKLTCGKIIK